MYLCVIAITHVDVDVDKLTVTGDFHLSEIAGFNPLNLRQFVINTFHNSIILWVCLLSLLCDYIIAQ